MVESLISDSDDSLDDGYIAQFVEQHREKKDEGQKKLESVIALTSDDDDDDDFDDNELLKATETFRNNKPQRQSSNSSTTLNSSFSNSNPNPIAFNVGKRGTLVPLPPESQSPDATPSSSGRRLTQRTLTGGVASSQPPNSEFSFTGAIENIHPTHHELNKENLNTYIYPSNLQHRDYQFNIIRHALFQNVLCALPTGLGKTFIASTVMLNWYRWTMKGKIIFMAPTKPLVAQQIHACLGITGIPKEDSCVLVGNNKIKPADRGEMWESKRVFFCTPQTVERDLARGLLDPKDVVCLVVDEAHRATGNYAYTQVVRLISECNKSFRILALTATPSGTVEGVQNVLTNLNISRTEIRSEDSIDIRQYVHKRDIHRVVVEPNELQEEIATLICEAAEPIVDEVRNNNYYQVSCARAVTQFGAVEANKRLATSDFARTNRGAASRAFSLLSILIKFGSAMNLLNVQGIGQFFKKIKEIKLDATHDKNGKSKAPGKSIGQFLNNEGFKKCYEKCEQLVQDENFIGHQKLNHVMEILDSFFANASASSRVIIFTDYRTSASEILRVLKRNCSSVKPHIFIGQQNSENTKKGKKMAKSDDRLPVEDEVSASSGMRQNTQQQVIEDFKKGGYNTLIATSIGEEGLDIGEVDLIICYDQSSSPIRSLQRMGRTGRKRNGSIYTLMTPQEEKKADKSMDAYKYLQRIIPDHSRFDYAEADRILPKEYIPECEYKVIEIPETNLEVLQKENEDAVLSELEPRKKRKKSSSSSKQKKAPARKKRRLPDNAQDGFVSASKLLQQAPNDDPTEDLDSIVNPKPSIASPTKAASQETEWGDESGVLNQLFSPSPPASSPLDMEVIQLESD